MFSFPNKAKYNVRKLITLSIATAVLSGCAGLELYNPPFDRPRTVSETSNRFRDSPSVRMIAAQSFSKRTNSEGIELFYHTFHILNAPNAIKNWQYHWVLGAGSNPSWKYVEVAEVVAYMPSHDDSTALSQIKDTAASVGGDAVVDLLREPITVSETGRRIHGYAYRGIVVRREVAPN